MTAKDLFALAAGWLGQSVADSEQLAPFVPGMVNTLLAEALPYENALRRFAGAAELERAPSVTAETMDAPLDWQEVLLRTALPYGLAADFCRDDENYALMDDFRARYLAALSDSLRAAPEAAADCYGPQEEG